MIILLLAGALAATLLTRRPGTSRVGFDPAFDTPRPITAADEVLIERMTWMEVRDAMAKGARTAIVATGGVEQNGAYVVAGKHNIIAQASAEAIARKLGNTLVAPVIPFVPEGAISPPDGHMRYPSTISVDDATYEALVRDVVGSLRTHGFREILLIGDSARNQPAMKSVATRLDKEWRAGGVRVRYIPEFYDWENRQAWLAARGFHEVDQGYHDELSVEAIIMSVDPKLVRTDERAKARLLSINGVPLAPVERTAALGRALIDHVATVTVEAINKRRAARDE